MDEEDRTQTRRYAGPPEVGVIEVRLSRLSQFFNSLDPSPFFDKDLDQDAEEYIVGSAEMFPPPAALRLIISMPVDQAALTNAPEIASGVHNYFAYRTDEAYRRLSALLREGRTAILIGLIFLVVCISVQQLAVAALPHGTVSDILAEGLAIVGWVAMWRPLEIFLYDWWPIRRRARLFARLASVPVELRAHDGAGPPPAKQPGR